MLKKTALFSHDGFPYFCRDMVDLAFRELATDTKKRFYNNQIPAYHLGPHKLI